MLIKKRNKSPIPSIIYSICGLLCLVVIPVVSSTARLIGEDAQRLNNTLAAERNRDRVIQDKAIQAVQHQEAMEEIGFVVPAGNVELSQYPNKKLNSEDLQKYTLTPNAKMRLSLTSKGVVLGYLHPDGKVFGLDGKEVPYKRR